MFDEKFWVALSFVIVIALLGKKILTMVSEGATNKAKEIENKLKSASQVKQEASFLKDSHYKQKKINEVKAAKILTNAKNAYNSMLENSRKELSSLLQNKTESAESSIDDAKEKALDELKKSAIEKAIAKFKIDISSEKLEKKLVDSALSKLETI